MKIKVWQIFLIGFGIVLFLPSSIIEPRIAGNLAADYLIVGGIILVGYYGYMRTRKKSKVLES